MILFTELNKKVQSDRYQQELNTNITLKTYIFTLKKSTIIVDSDCRQKAFGMNLFRMPFDLGY